MSKREDLQNNDAVWAAFYREGKDLGQIAKEFDCGIYDLSPWLTAPLMGVVRQANEEAWPLRIALRSIAENTCCESCQEAALVAREALSKGRVA